MNLKTMAEEANKALHRSESPADGLSNKAIKALVKEQAALGTLLHKQSKEIAALRHDVQQSRHRGGGFPWGLVLLAGGAYAAYRLSPAVREQIDGLLGRLDPGAEGNLHRAGDAAKDAVHDVAQGRNPGGALKQAGGELHRAAEKATEAQRHPADELKDDVLRQVKRSDA
ncbi:hypothetical protein GO986_00370 [Deinococcus sp. HMF7620]|uniref:Uncharacterized protein n=1 Tax=Deinococcus arboris TaxID=2682977 RepID=A0A7C9MP42_9DEIO|nr:hypothetical protein [Deinococcus arboris]MVN85224.1 hypothetical protein [Deinococcus arboris]